jgi:hypothetical protein
MLEGIAANPIIVGAYSNEDGVCPMLAAHRAGGRTNAIAFAVAWDRVAFRSARRTRDTRARRASQRELLILRSHLEASLLKDEDWTVAASPAAVRPGDPDRSGELRDRPGWSWTRIVRRLDEYERVLAHLEQERAHRPSEPAGVS